MKKIFGFLILFALVSCEVPIGVTFDATSGVAEVTFFFGNTINPSAVTPGEDFENVSEYELTLTGPGPSQVITITSGSLHLNLEPGEWSLIVNAYNSNGTTIGIGSKDFTLSEGPNDVNVQINPLGGSGLYPEIEWLDEPDDGFTISSSATAPSSVNFFDYKGLKFSATHDGEAGDFSFIDASIGSYRNISTGVVSGSLSFFSNHTVEIDMLWQNTEDVYLEDTTIVTYNPTNGWEFTMSSLTVPIKDMTGMMDYKIAFKEIRFIADDSTVYHTWTNPKL